MGKLTAGQRQALAQVECATDDNRSAYGLRLRLDTLGQLERKGMVRSTRGLGSIAMPHTAIKWSLTEAGREALEQRA